MRLLGLGGSLGILLALELSNVLGGSLVHSLGSLCMQKAHDVKLSASMYACVVFMHVCGRTRTIANKEEELEQHKEGSCATGWVKGVCR